MEELKSCPFCGSSNVNNLPAIQGDLAVWFPAEITCEQCGANINSVKQWNTRATDPLLEEMAGALEELDDMFDPTSRVGEIINNALQKYRER